MPLDRVVGHFVGLEPIAQPARAIGEEPRGGTGIQERLMMPRAVRLIAIGQRQRPIEGVGMRARQHSQRGEALGSAIGDAPGDATAPVVADQMKAPACLSASHGNIHGVVDELVEFVVRGVGGVRPRAGRIAALVRRYRAIPRRRKRRDLRSPCVERFGEAVEEKHERAVGRAGGQCVEGEAGPGRDRSLLDHAGAWTALAGMGYFA